MPKLTRLLLILLLITIMPRLWFLWFLLFFYDNIYDYLYGKLSNQLKGKIGERKVSRLLNEIISEYTFKFNDLLLFHKEKSTQIDHLLVCRDNTIVIIETKHWQGIYSVLNNGNTLLKRGFGKCYNPISQNIYHEIFLKEMLRVNRIKYNNILSVVVFSHNKACFSDNHSDKIIKIDELTDFVIDHIYTENKEDTQQLVCFFTYSDYSKNKAMVKQHIYNVKLKMAQSSKNKKDRT